MNIHPRLNDRGLPVTLHHPHVPSALETWDDPSALATAVPCGPMPEILNGIRFAICAQLPIDPGAWSSFLPSCTSFYEPPFDPKGRPSSAGAVVVEPDGRVWLVAPSNAFGGYRVTFPKGKTEGLDLRTTAIKEVFEETGLQVELIAHLIDVTRSTSRARYYLARRIGGSPTAMGWESQAVHLAPASHLERLLHHQNDHPVLKALLSVLPTLTHP